MNNEKPYCQNLVPSLIALKHLSPGKIPGNNEIDRDWMPFHPGFFRVGRNSGNYL